MCRQKKREQQKTATHNKRERGEKQRTHKYSVYVRPNINYRLFISILVYHIILCLPGAFGTQLVIEMASWDKFQSTHHEPYRRRSQQEPTHEYAKREYTRHYEGPRPVDGDTDMNRRNGLNATKFGIGFQRRQQDSITNTISQEHKKYEEISALKKEASSASRSKFLKEQNTRNGFNPITGAVVGRVSPERREGLKYLTDAMYTDSREVRNMTKLLNSDGRYFTDPAQFSSHSRPHQNQIEFY